MKKYKKKRCKQCGKLIKKGDEAFFRGSIVHAKICWYRMKETTKALEDKRIQRGWLYNLGKKK